ncbi:hypothetical protein [Streptomyces sp. NPDC046197]|uniref:hypothetical protein n=1 Tax=Streptomyces sp. NPDC046197 TaxID=3154337 RepID=UPI0033E13AFD
MNSVGQRSQRCRWRQRLKAQDCSYGLQAESAEFPFHRLNRLRDLALHVVAQLGCSHFGVLYLADLDEVRCERVQEGAVMHQLRQQPPPGLDDSLDGHLAKRRRSPSRVPASRRMAAQMVREAISTAMSALHAGSRCARGRLVARSLRLRRR